jgi:hypothetical protein
MTTPDPRQIGCGGWTPPSQSAEEKADDRLAPMAGSAYAVRVTRLSVLPPKEPLFSEQCTHISIVDEAAGEYLEIEQQSGSEDVKPQTIMVTPEEWPALKQAVETLLTEIHGQNDKNPATGSK